ncbi:MAG: hypothetical protein V4717_13850 [Bacteroidota bacterium]
MKIKFGILFYIFIACMSVSIAQAVELIYVTSSPQQSYAAQVLKKALLQKGYSLEKSNNGFVISLNINAKLLESEAFSVLPGATKITITGGDDRGIIYGSFAVAEAISNGTRLENITSIHEKPNYPLRAVKFDLPWDTYRHSLALDLHMETCKSLDYWKAFLDMMAENRLNSLSLWNLHPYPFMIKPKNFPEASPFNDVEMKTWKALFSGIFKMAGERAIEVYIIPFNIFVSPEFSKAHNVNMNNLDHQFFVSGDTSELVKRYTRECVTQMLQEYPGITGMGLTLGEGMGGMSPQQRENWMRETIIEGMRLSGRKLKLVHRIPFSSTTGSLGVTSIETEQLTRKAIEEEGAFSFLQPPIYADLKYNWSHALSTPTLVKVHGGKLYDTYFKPEPKNYKITWTARNEDIFCLRWGVPDFVRAHVAENNQSYTGGYFIGSETYIPAKDYFTSPGIKKTWKYAFERQWLYYKLWGRLLYNPGTPDAVFEAAFTRRYGQAGKLLLQASALAGKTPLRLASLFDFTMDLTLYSEGFMALDNAIKRVEYISINRLIKQPVTDPNYISVKDYVATIAAGDSFASQKITPVILINMLERDCHSALLLVKTIQTKGNTALMFEVADIKVWSNMGLHFAEKLKAAVALETYRISGGEANKQMAINHLKKALQYWDAIIAITRPLYNDMPLVHYSEQNGVRSKENQSLLFHWEKIRPEVAKDISIATSSMVDAGTKN